MGRNKYHNRHQQQRLRKFAIYLMLPLIMAVVSMLLQKIQYFGGSKLGGKTVSFAILIVILTWAKNDSQSYTLKYTTFFTPVFEMFLIFVCK
jgi:hypothetical protein